MRLFTTLLACGLLVSSALAAPQQQQAYAGYNPYLSNPATTTPAPILHPPAQVHYVNIGQELNGDYKFGYDTGKGPSGQSFREETRLPDGTVKGQYGYLDRDNKMRIVKYTAGTQGFNIDSDSALGEQQLQGARAQSPHTPEPQRAPQQQQAPSQSYYQPQPIPRQPAYQGLASAASSQPASIAQYSHPSQFNPAAYAPQGSAPSAPYTGYTASPQAYAPNYSVNPSVPGYPQRTLTPDQIRQQNALNARARQAALARQQQQEAHIRQQQQAATEAILAQQKAAQQAEDQYNAQARAQSQYSGPAAYAPQQSYAPQSYAQQPAPQPSYAPQYQQASYASPVSASSASAATSPAAAPQQQQSYGPRHTSSDLKPDLLSNFIQLPGVRLIQLDRKPAPKQAGSYPSSTSFGLTAGAATTPGSPGSGTRPDEEYQGPVVINAALLNYNIGSSQPATPAPSKAAKAAKA